MALKLCLLYTISFTFPSPTFILFILYFRNIFQTSVLVFLVISNNILYTYIICMYMHFSCIYCCNRVVVSVKLTTPLLTLIKCCIYFTLLLAMKSLQHNFFTMLACKHPFRLKAYIQTYMNRMCI